MAPKKDKGKDKAPESSVSSLYVKREPLPPQDPPNVDEIEDIWKVNRDAFLCPLPLWDSERVDTTEWKPSETAELYADTSFSVKLLPRPFAQHISAWKRAHAVSDNTAPEEQPPEAKPPEPPPEPEPVVVDPKAKGKAKAEPKGKKGEPAPVTKPTTAQQFAEIEPSGETVVVTPAEFRTRLFELTNDDCMPALSQAIAAQLAIIGEHFRMLPAGCFLWELIYPQDEDGVPLFNPHGKYIVKLYVQGKWREVMVDDVVPVGSASGSGSLHANMFPSAGNDSIWPVILSKALIRAFQHDLRAPMLAAIQALTGFSQLQMPLTWQGIRSAYDSRPFCCLQMSSKVDLEARNMMMASAMMASPDPSQKQQKDSRGGKGGAMGVPALPSLSLGGAGGGDFGHAGPKLSSNPIGALLQFLVCELEEDPPQIRLKASTWRPQGGTPRKVVLDVAESDAADEEDGDAPRADTEDRQSDAEDHDDDDDDDRRSQRSPSGEQTVPSARSKDEGEEDGEEEADDQPPAAEWPEAYPAALMQRSEVLDHRDGLQGGYWVGIEKLEDICDSFVLYIPPGNSALTAQLDTAWKQEARNEAYVPQPISLLRMQLTLSTDVDTDIEPTPRADDELATPRDRCPPWHRASFLYEPLRLNSSVTPAKPVIGPGSAAASCWLQQVNGWNPAQTPVGGPEHMSLSVSEHLSSASRSTLLPSGEHWYLIVDDACRAGSVLSAHVDGAVLSRSKSSMEFLDPCEYLPSLGIAMAKLGTTEYPPQQGFSVWAKAEVIMDNPEAHETLQVLSYVSDPALRSNLRISLLQLEQDQSEDPGQRCALWSLKTLTRVPLQPIMTLPLGNAERPAGDVSVKHILMLEANAPAATKGGNFALHVMLPPKKGEKLTPPPAEGEEAPPAPLRLEDYTVDQITRWSGDVVPNEKGIVLRERIVIPHGNGDVTATLRVTVTGLPKVVLNAQLLAQLAPTQEMRPKVDGATPEPFVPGAPIDPKEYSGRQNWLACKRLVAEETGIERVMFLHVLLCEGSTYLLDVFVDAYKGPDALEGGQWSLEVFGSSPEIEVGADTMEKDLEVLVRKSWEETGPDAPQPPRAERAAKSRKRWLKSRGLLEGDDEDLDEQEAAPDPKAKAKPEPKAKGKAGKNDPPPEPEINKEEQEAEWLAAALKRAGEESHANNVVDDFVKVHTIVEPTLIEEDPYTIAPVLDDMIDPEKADTVAIQGLGMRGTAEVRKEELENSIAKWAKIQEEVATAIDRNKQALIDLTAWSEKTVSTEPKFMEIRESMRNSLQSRYQAKQALKDLVGNAEKLDAAEIQTALDQAETQEVRVWDEELVETGGEKKSFIEDFNALKDRLSRLEAEPLSDEDSREALSKLSASVGKLQTQLKSKKVPLPEEMLDKELLQKASEAIAAAIALAEQEDDAAEAA